MSQDNWLQCASAFEQSSSMLFNAYIEVQYMIMTGFIPTVYTQFLPQAGKACANDYYPEA